MLNPLKKNTFNFFDQEKMLKDIQAVCEIEQALVPSCPSILGLDISVQSLPAEVIGGDCYDVFSLDEQNVMMYLSDVTGHGIPAGVVVAVMNFLIFTLSKYHKNAKEILSLANTILKERTKANMFITTVMCNWNAEKNLFQYVQAGHPQIIHYQAKKKKVELCASGGVALGMVDDISGVLEEREICLEKGDSLVLYSDGITEMKNCQKEFFGLDRLMEAVEKKQSLEGAEVMVKAILSEVRGFQGKAVQEDDVTLMVMSV